MARNKKTKKNKSGKKDKIDKKKKSTKNKNGKKTNKSKGVDTTKETQEQAEKRMWKPIPKFPGKNVSNLTMNLFGMPHQFPAAVDPRVGKISEIVGKKFSENFLMETPFITLIPGRPTYMPTIKSKQNKNMVSMALLEANEGSFKSLNQMIKEMGSDDFKLYDFRSAYAEYITYVNVLCRAGAAFLELKDTVKVGGTEYSFQRFDWSSYKWNTLAAKSTVDRVKTAAYQLGRRLKDSIYRGSKEGKYITVKPGKGENGLNDTKSNMFQLESWNSSKKTEPSVRELLKNYSYVQFYIDPKSGPSESLSNSTGSPGIKGALESGSGMVKEMHFMANAAHADWVGGSMGALSDKLSDIHATVGRLLNADKNSGLMGAIGNVLNLGGSTIKGHNILMPDIYQNTSFTKSFSVIIHLKSPYANKLAWYLNVFVPWMHCLALCAPPQETANSFSAPFLVKGYIDGIYSCNLGMITSMNAQKAPNSWSIDGLPAEIDITLTIDDLYSDMMLSPSSDPKRFLSNSSLIEFLCTSCGMSVIAPNQAAKWDNIINRYKDSILDIPNLVNANVSEYLQREVDAWTGLK